MKKIISFAFLTLFLTGCSFFQVHKNDVVQGNIITQENVQRLHKGMSMSEVKSVMGEPILINIFTPQHADYVYTFQKGHGTMTETRVTCSFSNGRLAEIQQVRT